MDVDVPGNIRAVPRSAEGGPGLGTRGDPVPSGQLIGISATSSVPCPAGLSCQRAPDRGDAVLEPADAAAVGRIGAADAIVTDFDPERRGRRGATMLTFVALACLATLASPSDTTK